MERTEDVIFAEWRASPSPELEAELVMALRTHAMGVIWPRLGHEKRQEIANDCILIVLQRPEAFKGLSKFSTWFHSLVKRQASWEMRDCNFPEEVELQENLFGSEDVETRLLLQDLRKVLTPEEHALMNRLLEGKTIPEIVEEHGSSVATVYRKIADLRKTVTEFLHAT